jgi:hypothetical protein
LVDAGGSARGKTSGRVCRVGACRGAVRRMMVMVIVRMVVMRMMMVMMIVIVMMGSICTGVV